MCGIIGYVGEKKNALKVLITGLKALEYRGYDSSGIAYFKNQKIEVAKEKGKIEKLEKILNLSTSSNIGIAHTRWATCGIPDKINAHPHSSGKITIVHNGIIEHYEQLKKELEKEGYHFISQTDSETIAVLLDKYYKESQDILKSIIKTKKRLTGSYALAILCEDIPSKIFAIRKDNPLIIAKSNDASFIASDIPAILNYTNQYYILDENEIAILSKDKIDFKNDTLETINKKVLTFNGDKNSSTKGDFSHYMLKEIFEEKDVIKRIMKDYNDIDQLIQNLSFLKKYKKFDIVACGSAYHIGVIAKYLIEEHISIPVNVEVASEYRYKNNFLDNESLAIFISQSGETADTLACVRKVKEKNIDTLGIINVEENLEFTVTIPKTSLDEINKIIELGKIVNIYIDEKKVTFDLGDCVVTSRLISGTYPDTSRLIPEVFSQSLKISTRDLLGAVDRASILLTERNNVVKLNMEPEAVYVSAISMEVGRVVEQLNDFYYEGEPLVISFSAKYLLEAIKALNSEEITLSFTGDMRPIIVTSKTNSNLIELILPVRTYN